MPVSVFHQLTATTPDDPAYEIRPSHFNESHAVTLNISATEISGLFSNANGVSFGLSANSITASIAAGGAPGSVSAGTTNFALGEVVFSNSNGVTFGLDGATVTAQHNALTSQSNQAASAANGSFAFQTISFSNVNGVSFATAAGNAIQASVAAQTNQTVGGYFVGNTTGQSSSSTVDARSVSIDGAGIVSAGWSAGSIRISATQSNQALSGQNGSFTFQTASFSNANGISFGTSAGLAITASHNGITSQTNQTGAIYVTAQSTGQSSSSTYDLRTLSFVPDGIISAGWSGGSFRVSATQSNQAASNSAGSFTFQTLNFSNANNVTFGTSAGGIITASVAAPGAAAENNWHHALGANTAGNTTASGSTIGLSGINMTISGTNDSVLNLSVPATSSLSAEANITIGTTGSTIGFSVAAPGGGGTISSFQWPPAGANTIQSVLQSTSIAMAFNLPNAASFNFFRLPVSMTTRSTTISTLASSANASNENRYTFNLGVYSMGVGASSKSLMSVFTASTGMTQRVSISVAANGTQYSVTLGLSAPCEGGGTTRTTQYSISNTNYSLTTQQIVTEFSGGRMLDIGMSTSLSAGNYWMLFGVSSSQASNSTRFSAASNLGVSYSNHFGLSNTNITIGIMGSTNMTSGGLMGAGSFTTAGGGTVSALPISAISSSASHVRPYFQMLRSA